MRKPFWFSVVLFIVGIGIIFGLSSTTSVQQKQTHQLIQPSEPHVIEVDPLDNMPIISGGYGEIVSNTALPVEQRGPEFRQWLAASVKISVSGGSGSGTICYYDSTKNIAYVATCGHLWNAGTMTAEEGERRNLTCRITIWYKNDEKLAVQKDYTAKVIFYSHRSGCDTGLVTFQPDFVPSYFPIAPLNYNLPVGSHQHSCGCDAGNEVAHYDVEIIGPQGNDLITKYNSPRPGRSGGGLLSDDGYYIGTCWGTSRKDGSGIGYFTPVNVIHQYWKQQRGYEFLLDQPPFMASAARQLPIVTKSGQPMQFPKDYIPLPDR